MKTKFDSSLKGAGCFTFIRAKEMWFQSRWRRVICCGCRAGRGIGLICARKNGFAPFACFKILPAGRRTTQRAVWIAALIRCVSDPLTLRHAERAELGELSLALPFDSAEIRSILLDIEGTTTPIDFDFKTLFPFAREH